MLRSACYPCLITAETEPPGRLHSSTGSPYEPRSLAALAVNNCGHQLIRITPGPFQSQAGRLPGVTPWPVLFVLAATWTSYEPLHVSFIFADVAQRQTGYACNP